MRQILFAITLCLFPLVSMAAERVDLRRELTPFAVGQLEDRVWDFTTLSTVDDAATAYTAFKAGVYYESTGPSCRAYAQCGDTLVYRGYNTGRHEKMLLDAPAPSRVTRGDRGRAFKSSFGGRGLLYGEYATSETGTLSSEGCGYGRLVMYGDTVAAYLHKETISTSKLVEGDSAAVAGRITIYRWLLDGGVCPVAVQTESDDGRSSLFAVDEFRAKELISNTARPEEAPDDAAVMAVLESAYGRRTPSGVEVGFRAGADTDIPPLHVDVYLMDSTGNIYASATTESSATCCLPLPPVYTGALFVAVNASGRAGLSYKFMVGL